MPTVMWGGGGAWGRGEPTRRKARVLKRTGVAPNLAGAAGWAVGMVVS
jgi:hypothetical protein